MCVCFNLPNFLEFKPYKFSRVSTLQVVVMSVFDGEITPSMVSQRVLTVIVVINTLVIEFNVNSSLIIIVVLEDTTISSDFSSRIGQHINNTCIKITYKHATRALG